MASTNPKPSRPQQTEAWLRALLDASALEPFCEIVVITPDMARALMTRNQENRKLSRALLTQIADDIKNGRWQFNGESVIIAKSGELNDGQHRLQAIIEAGIAAQVVLVGGASRESRMTLDMGKNRGVHDYLNLVGIRNANVVASAARLAIAFELGGEKNFNQINWVSKTLARERGVSDKLLHAAANWAAGHDGHQMAYLCPPSPLAFCYYIITKVGADQGLEFMDKLATGEDQKRGSPILTARRYLPTFGQRHREGKIGLIVRAWNAWVKGEEGTPDNIHGRYPLPKLLKPAPPPPGK